MPSSAFFNLDTLDFAPTNSLTLFMSRDIRATQPQHTGARGRTYEIKNNLRAVFLILKRSADLEHKSATLRETSLETTPSGTEIQSPYTASIVLLS